MISSLDRIGRAQHGVVTRTQALACVNPESLKTMVRREKLLLVHESVYRFPGAPLTPKLQLMAAALAAPSGSVVSHQSAGWLHQLGKIDDSVAHVTVDGEKSRKRVGYVIHYSNFKPAESVVVDKIPVTSLERTIVDLASCVTRKQLVRLLDDVVIEGRTNYDKVWRAMNVAGRQGRKGVAFLRTILEERLEFKGDIQSKIQRRIVRAAAVAGLPVPETEWKVPTRKKSYFLDVAWPDKKLGAEADGYSVHGQSKLKFDQDKYRHNDITALDWTLIYFTARMSVDEIAQHLREVWTK